MNKRNNKIKNINILPYSLSKKMRRIMSKSAAIAVLGATTLPVYSAPMEIAVSSDPVITGEKSVGTNALWLNAGTIEGVSIDLRATVTEYDAENLYFGNVGDNPAILLYNDGTKAAEITLRWEVFKSGTNQSVLAYGNPSFSITDIDGVDGQPYTRETVVPSLYGLTGFSLENPTNLQTEIVSGLVKVTGTEDQGGENNSSVIFRWNNVASWDISYRIDLGANNAASIHDGNGELAFLNEKRTDFLGLDLDADNSTTGGNNYLTSYTLTTDAIALSDTDDSLFQHTALGTDLGGATIILTNAQANDVLTVGALPAGISSSIDTSVAGKVTVSLTGDASVADYQTALRAISFENKVNTSSTTSRIVEIFIQNTLYGTSSQSAFTTITVAARPNILPIATAESVTTNEDTAITIDVLSNDSDDDGDLLTITNLSTPSNGTVSIVDGKVIYTPNANYNGTDTFTYTPNDGIADGSAVTVTVNITAINDMPVGVAESVTTNEDTQITIDVLANDTDVDTNPLTITNLSTPSNGTVSIVDGKVVYIPNANYNGTDTFTYTPNDGTVDGSAITVTVNVTPINDMPVGTAETVTTNEDTQIIIDVLANDTDIDSSSLNITNLSTPSNGIVSIVDGKVVYTPNANYNGIDTFTYTPNDGTVDGSAITVTVNVTPVNDIPVGVAESVTTDEDTAITIDVLSNDTDVDGNLLTITNLSTPSNGIVSIVDGKVVYTPNENYNGTDTFTYTPNDGTVDGSAITVTVNVTPINDIPVGVVESVTTTEDAPITIDVIDNDTDVDADTLSVTNLSTPANGTVIITDGKVVYTPTLNFVGEDTFTYTPNDGTVDGVPVLVTVTVLKDTDSDGIIDTLDLDDDNDGIPDLVELDGDPLRDTDGDGVIDSEDLDSDNDGLLDLLESGQDVSVLDTDGNGVLDSTIDADNDGLLDVADVDDNDVASIGKVVPVNTDGDEKRDFQDVDSDNDGLSDVIEAGIPAENDANNDGMIDGAVDANGIPTVVASVVVPVDTDEDNVPDYRDLDSDNDGLTDIVEANGEDVDGNGLVDTNGTLVDPATLPDVDGNSIADVLEPNNNKLPGILDMNGDGVVDDNNDTDKDGLPNVTDERDEVYGTKPMIDTDGDGISNEYDLDDDNDGIPDLIEENGDPLRDTDGDGVVDSLDLDSDNDGILDIIEVNGIDVDKNGRVDDILDSDNDGLADIADLNPNKVDTPADRLDALNIIKYIIVDTDSDTVANFQDIDSDNDGLSDMIEAGISPENDLNNDGMVDGTVDVNGITPATQSINEPADTDNDGVRDYVDLDSDNDGLVDTLEINALDKDKDGQLDIEGTLINGSTLPDTDENGIVDILEPNNVNLPAYVDRNGDGIIDDITDTDGDGIADVIDGNPTEFSTAILEDTDGDNIPDVYDVDNDNDGIPDLVELDGDTSRDTDGDGVIDSLDLDSDNDGILDIVEAGGNDIDNNGVIDNSSDLDKDGLLDIADLNPETVDVPLTMEEAQSITVLAPIDTDKDGVLNFQDVDSDNDGISDLVEAGIDVVNDVDNDGMLDDEVNENGVSRTVIPVNILVDTDNDGTPNVRDLDSDNDGLIDEIEAGREDVGIEGLIDASTLPDTNGNGIPNYMEYQAEFLPDVVNNVELNTTAVIDVLSNDNIEVLDASTLQITGTKNPGDSLVVEGEGVWSIRSDNFITFRPEESFILDPTNITYSLEDVNGERTGMATVNVNYVAAVRPDIKSANLKAPVTINVLANDNGDLNVATVEIVLPEGFRKLHPNAIISDSATENDGSTFESGRRLVVPGQGTWWVNIDGSVSYKAQEGIPLVNPTPIGYKVYDNAGNELMTDALIVLKQTVVEGVQDDASCQTHDSVPVFTKVGLGLLGFLGTLLGMFLFRKEK